MPSSYHKIKLPDSPEPNRKSKTTTKKSKKSNDQLTFKIDLSPILIFYQKAVKKIISLIKKNENSNCSDNTNNNSKKILINSIANPLVYLILPLAVYYLIKLQNKSEREFTEKHEFTENLSFSQKFTNLEHNLVCPLI